MQSSCISCGFHDCSGHIHCLQFIELSWHVEKHRGATFVDIYWCWFWTTTHGCGGRRVGSNHVVVLFLSHPKLVRLCMLIFSSLLMLTLISSVDMYLISFDRFCTNLPCYCSMVPLHSYLDSSMIKFLIALLHHWDIEWISSIGVHKSLLFSPFVFSFLPFNYLYQACRR